MVEERGFSESQTVINIKLWLGFVLSVIGGATGIYSYLTDFAKTKWTVMSGSLLYLIILGIYTYWMAFRIPQTCFRGTPPSGKEAVWIRSKLLLPEALFKLSIIEKQASVEPTTKSVLHAITSLFTPVFHKEL